MKTIITERQRGLKFKHGKFIGMLPPGKYRTFGDTQISVVDICDPIDTELCTIDRLLENSELARSVEVVDVDDSSLALHYIDGRFLNILNPGRYAFWKDSCKHSFTFTDASTPEVDQSVPRYIFGRIPASYYIKVEVAEYQKARLYYDQKPVGLLGPGVHYFWRNDVMVTVGLIDTRLIKLDIVGQEMLTQDKVTVRINFVCNYKIDDCVKIVSEIDDYREQLHVAAQLALRDYVGSHKLDEILESKLELSEAVFEKLKARGRELYLNICSADVKDIILPGEIRDIMNTVLVAEKKAQANVITRREEVASTRSLLNTARLMEDNPTLYRLKELEYVERICENVSCINLNGSSDMLSQLADLLGRAK